MVDFFAPKGRCDEQITVYVNFGVEDHIMGLLSHAKLGYGV